MKTTTIMKAARLNYIVPKEEKPCLRWRHCKQARGGQATQIFIHRFARWRFLRNFVWKGCNFVTLCQITEKSDRPRMETILHIVLRCACFQREASANFGIINNSAYISTEAARRCLPPGANVFVAAPPRPRNEMLN